MSSFLDTPEMRERDRLINEIERSIKHLPVDRVIEVLCGNMTTPALKNAWNNITAGGTR